MYKLHEEWINKALEYAITNESLIKFLNFLKDHITDADIDKYDLESFEIDEKYNCVYGTFFIKELSIHLMMYKQDYEVIARVGVDYKRYWDKFHNCIIDTYFPMKKRDYINFEGDVVSLIGDKNKAKQYYNKRYKSLKSINKYKKGRQIK